MKRLTILIDMDGVLVDFQSGIDCFPEGTGEDFGGWDNVPTIFSKMQPMPGAIEAFKKLASEHDVYIVSTAPWHNSTAWSDKRDWVVRHLGEAAEKRLILTHHKNLVRGDVIIDDRTKRGVAEHEAHHIHFGRDPDTGERNAHPDWASALSAVDRIARRLW
jgi:5'(3')-deoxyribonucleotidase